MTTATAWTAVCACADIVDRTGICVLVDGHQVAVFRRDDRFFALDNRDPCSGAQVLSRGILGDCDGEPVVASPLYKQRFVLSDGRCLDDPAQRVRPWPLRVIDGRIEIGQP